MQATLTFDVNESEVDAFIERLSARWPDIKIVVKSAKSLKDPGEDVQFERFWEAYPRHINRKLSLRNWQTRMKEGCKPDEMVRAAENYAATVKANDDKFVMHPSTFLGPNARWIEWLQIKEEKPYSPF